jgi:hypothetical protein
MPPEQAKRRLDIADDLLCFGFHDVYYTCPGEPA